MAKVEINCPKCGRGHNVEESWLGRKGRCKKCQNVFVLAKPQPPEVRQADQPSVVRADVAAIDARPNRNFATEEVVPAEWQPGDVILDLYEVQEVFESGGMGLVYKVHHKGWNLPLAVKSPREEWFQTEDDKQNFEREAETWVNLGLHPHIVSCHYVRRLGGIPRLFAEYMEGGSLEVVLNTDAIPIRQRKPSIPPKLAKVIDEALVDKPQINVKTARELRRALEDGV